MASNFTSNISENFDLQKFADEVTQQYQAKGFQVRAIKMKQSVKLVLDKNCGGINMVLGLGQGISATCSIMGKDADMLSVTFSDGDWIGKIVGLIAGLFCCIPLVTAIIGVCKQLSLSKDLGNDMQMIISNME